MMIRTYSDLLLFDSFKERFAYLKLDGVIGELKFNSQRYLNQRFYTSNEWSKIKREILLRDEGHDLSLISPQYQIFGVPIVHHMNPLTPQDFKSMTKFVWDPEYLILVSRETHDAIHYGSLNYKPIDLIKPRSSNDTSPWREL